MAISIVVAFFPVLIGVFDNIFNNLGLPIGGLLMCIFVAFVWKTDSALDEMEHGFEGVKASLFAKVWPFFIKVICPAAILYNIITNFI
jgi:NSS family neurotransmitter:Na+ symporter